MAVPVWDVVVVGAGPAGSSAARAAASVGARVLLVDQARFPRYKTCGGGLIGTSLAELPSEALAAIRSRITANRFTLRGRRAVRVRTAESFLALADREAMDTALVEAARAAGTEFRDGVSVRGIREGDGVIELRTASGGEPILARAVVGADGVGGRIGRAIGVRAERVDLGLETELELSPEQAAAFAGETRIDWGPGDGSYGWLFPKGLVATVGVIERRGEAATTREYLADWIRRLGLSTAPVLRSSGHLTSWREADSPLAAGRVLVAGDAAALLEPWTREGISFALRSGRWAGEAAARIAAADAAAEQGGTPGAGADAAAAYSARVRRELAPEITAGALVLAAFERHPALVHRMLRSRLGAGFFVRFCRGQARLSRLVARRPIATLIRLAGR